MKGRIHLWNEETKEQRENAIKHFEEKGYILIKKMDFDISQYGAIMEKEISTFEEAKEIEELFAGHIYSLELYEKEYNPSKIIYGSHYDVQDFFKNEALTNNLENVRFL